MKVCPFCKEHIHNDASKCRYCASNLASGQTESLGALDGSATASDKVVFVVDQDLIRFAKFAAAVLAIFITVGIFLWGFDIKQAAKEARDSADAARAAKKEAADASEEINGSRKQITEAKQQIDETHKEISEKVANLDKQVTDAQTAAAAGVKRMQELLAQAEEDEGKIRSKVPVTATASRPGCGTDRSKLGCLRFPSKYTSKGQRIGLIELAGGYTDSDLTAYFEELGLPKPKVVNVSVDRATNSPSNDPLGSDSQVTLDIEVAGAAAPGAEIVVYFGRNTNEGFLNAIRAATNDTVNQPSILTISWGLAEAGWPKPMLEKMNEALNKAAMHGITVFCSAGDNGASDGLTDGKRHVDFPASSPWVVACGGSRLNVSEHRIASEVVWNDGTGASGGGVSDFFPRPDWQAGVKVPARQDGQLGRGVPDVAANAAPETGYRIHIHGENIGLGGTSAVAPLWAGLIARINEALGRNVGYITPDLYLRLGPSGAFRSITQGNNSLGNVKGFSAGPGWNPVTGWGSPNGGKLLEGFGAKGN